MQWLKSLGSTILQTPQKSDTTQATHTKVNKEKVQKLADTSEPPVCREASTSNEQEPLIDISRVITRYEDQHQKIFIRNHLQRKKRILLTRYNALFLEENLRRFKSCEGVHKQSEGNEDEQTTSPIRINISPVSKVERTTKLIKEKEVLACTALKLPPIPEQSTVATLQLVSS
ncbi:uncharacterized protein [Watersipora subatra]|uniref:uncharacterized protein n=1 Tax=Watersipora subatra TaxID=2589382 RepID=UPI00355B98B7